MKISRRALFGGGAAATGLAAFGGYRFMAPAADTPGTIADFIVRHVPQAKVTDEAVKRFVADVADPPKRRLLQHNFEVHMALLANPSFKRFLNANQMFHQMNMERSLISLFLKSTDVLIAPDAPQISYIAFADPYETGCSNLLADFALPPEEV